MAIGKLVQKDGKLLYSTGDLWSADDATNCNCNCGTDLPYTCSCNVGSLQNGFNLSGTYTASKAGAFSGLTGSTPTFFTLCKNNQLSRISHEIEYSSVTWVAGSHSAIFDSEAFGFNNGVSSYYGSSALNIAPYNAHYNEPQLICIARNIGGVVDILAYTVSLSTGATLFSQSGYTFPLTIRQEYVFFLIGNDYHYTLTHYINGTSAGSASGRWYVVTMFPPFPPTAVTTSFRPCNFIFVPTSLGPAATNLTDPNVIDVDWVQTVVFS